MSVDNWKLWLVPFAVWGLAMAWYSGYQAGYQEGHVTAWEMAKPSISMLDNQLLSQRTPETPDFLSR